MPKVCLYCRYWHQPGRQNTPGFEDWKGEHHCPINHKGSGGSMESAGVLQIYKRSVEERYLRYTMYLGDGDSKSFQDIVNVNPYPGKTCNRYECVGHVPCALFPSVPSGATPDNKKLFNDSRNHCKRVITEAKSSYAEATRHSIASQRIGSHDVWRICNSVLNRGKSTIPPLFNGPEVLTTSTDKANLFAGNFSYNSTLDDSYQLLPDFPSRTEHRLTSRKITARMVSHAIYHLDTCKATGPDRIPSIVLKMCSPELSPVLAKLYNKCLAKSCFPSCWKSSEVVPAFKNDGDRSDPGKYRPISLLSIVSKIFESFINDSLIKHLDSTGLFSDL